MAYKKIKAEDYPEVPKTIIKRINDCIDLHARAEKEVNSYVKRKEKVPQGTLNVYAIQHARMETFTRRWGVKFQER